jgi:hypothetical protein
MFSFSTLTPIVKPLELISVIEPIGMLDFEFNLGIDSYRKVKWA